MPALIKPGSAMPDNLSPRVPLDTDNVDPELARRVSVLAFVFLRRRPESRPQKTAHGPSYLLAMNLRFSSTRTMVLTAIPGNSAYASSPPGASGNSFTASVAGETDNLIRQGTMGMRRFYDYVPVSQNQSWRVVFKCGSRSQ